MYRVVGYVGQVVIVENGAVKNFGDRYLELQVTQHCKFYVSAKMCPLLSWEKLYLYKEKETRLKSWCACRVCYDVKSIVEVGYS